MILRKGVPYTLALIVLGVGFWGYSVSSNYVTMYNNMYPTQGLSDPFRDLIGVMDRDQHPDLVTFIDIVPLVWLSIYLVAGLYNSIWSKSSFFLAAMVTETIIIVLNGIFHVVTILPDAYGEQPVCDKEYDDSYPSNGMLWDLFIGSLWRHDMVGPYVTHHTMHGSHVLVYRYALFK